MTESINARLDRIEKQLDNFFNIGAWVRDIYDNYVVITRVGDENNTSWRIDYTVDENDNFVFSSKDEWIEVTQEWNVKSLKVLDGVSDDDWLIADGYLFLFGGKDLTGEYFTSSTDSESSYTKTVERLAIDAEHAIKITKDYPGDEALGYVDATTIRDDKYGRFARHLLDRRNEYVRYVYEPMIRAGLIGSSTEAVFDGVQKQDGHIVKWPLKKQALTVESAEPRLMTEHQLNIVEGIVKQYPAFKSVFFRDSLGEKENASQKRKDIQGNLSASTIKKEKKMNEEELKSLINNAIESQKYLTENDIQNIINNTIKTYQDKTPASKKGAVVTQDETDKYVESLTPKHRLGFQLQAVKSIALNQPGALTHAHKAVLGQNESVPQDGGFLVGTEQDNMLHKKMHDSSVFASLASLRVIGEGANSVDFYGIKENSRANGSRFGGVSGYRVAEGQEITSSKMKFYKFTLKPEKYAALVYATNEVARNAALLGQEIGEAAPMELAFMLDDDMINGSAAGYPEGILNANCLVTVNKEAGQAANTVLAENIINMRARLWAKSHKNAVWFINQDVEPQLHQLNLPVGTGGALVYMPPGGLSDSPYGRLYGRPVIPTEFNPTLGTVGDIVLADYSQYKLASIGDSVEVATSIHVQFITDQMVWRFIAAYDGQATWEGALTPYKGTNTQSPFVALQTRS